MKNTKHNNGSGALDCPVRHTSGPWRTSEIRGMGVTHCVSTDEVEPRIICEINAVRSAYEANARLVAASPELLEACKAVVGGIPQGEPGHVDLFAAFKLCEVAIAKAEGKP